jgi:Raf kinase inhibitor-like YbhB/YbcL family protein
MSLDRPVAPDPYSLLPSVPRFALLSADLAGAVDAAEHVPLDPRHAHLSVGGENLSPALEWSGFPEETKGFLVTCFDPDAPTESGFWHWLAVGLPASVTRLERGAGSDGGRLPEGAFHVRNDMGARRYDGSAPPAGDRPHRYFFAVHALDIDDLGLDDDATPAVVAFSAGFHVLARAILVATYSVPPTQ